MGNKAIREVLKSATALHQAGDLLRAEQTYLQILRVDPANAAATHLLGVIECQRERFAQAIELVKKAIALAPGESNYHNTLGNAFRGVGRLPEAIAAYRQACKLSSGNLGALNNLAMALDEADQTAEALECFDRLIAIKSDVAEWHTNRGSVQFNAGALQASLESQRKAISLKSDLPGAHIKLATALLATGAFEEGWREFAWRFRAGVIADPTLDDSAPIWDGSPIMGKTLLIQAEQGFGDLFQCARYLVKLADQGIRVVLRCQPQLRTLMQRVAGVHEAVSIGEPIPPHDLQVPVFTLPLVFGTTEATIPRVIPYIHADSDKIERFKLPAGRTRVGLVWTGSTSHGNNRRRSCPVEELNALAGIDRIDFYRLQMPADLPAPSGLQLIDSTAALNDFDDTAALIANLDLVISVDTSVAHLAGAMGKPVWILLPFAAEWRWMSHRNDSPWYPSARLFRQSVANDWSGVLQQVRQALCTMAVRE